VVRCPCCNSDAILIKALPRQSIVTSLRRLMLDDGIDNYEFGDYEIFRCSNCCLEFADPMVEPAGDFYDWVTRSGDYYPATRWEWQECKRQLEALQVERGERSLEVLDLGCGSGRFLKMLRTVPGCHAVGVDINEAGIEACRDAGLEAYHGDLEFAFVRQFARYHVVTLWHVIEHVSDPIGLLSMVKENLAEGGCIYLSVPMSPLSYEASWPDPLNYPPHHLTRWNVDSLQALGRRLDMSLQLVMPRAQSLPSRVIHSLLLQSGSPFARLTRKKKLLRLLTYLCRHPWYPFLEGYRQLNRPRLNGLVLPDVVLACLTRARSTSPCTVVS